MNLDIFVLLPMVVVLAGITFALGWFVNSKTGQNKISTAEQRAKEILADADRDATNLKKEKLLEVKEEFHKKKQELEHELTLKRNKLQALENQINTREESLERKLELVGRKEREAAQLRKEAEDKGKQWDEKQSHLHRLIQEENSRLERVSGMTRDEAKKILMGNMVTDAKAETAQTV